MIKRTEDFAQNIAPILRPREHLLYATHPSVWRWATFGALSKWLYLGLCCIWLATAMRISVDATVSLDRSLAALTFIATGIALFGLLPIWALRTTRRMVYAVTTERLIAIQRNRHHALVFSIDILSCVGAQVRMVGDVHGHITFQTDDSYADRLWQTFTGKDRQRYQPGFYCVHDPHAVANLVRRARERLLSPLFTQR
ncbi:MAG: hypothetical protein H6707_01625 [Deltaproteobacteria bacterium]|nr:hypothetical protein [Deltaproteobacteria bacterium]